MCMRERERQRERGGGQWSHLDNRVCKLVWGLQKNWEKGKQGGQGDIKDQRLPWQG